MKLFKKIFAPVLMSVLLCLSFIMPSFINVNGAIKERTVDVEELGMLTYEQKVEQMLEPFDSYEADIDNNVLMLDLELSVDISDLSGFEFLTTLNDPIIKKYKTSLDIENEKFYIVTQYIQNGKIIDEEKVETEPYYDGENDDYLIAFPDGSIESVKESITANNNLNECFVATMVATSTVAVTLLAATILVLAPEITTSVITIVKTVYNWVKSFFSWFRSLFRRVATTVTTTVVTHVATPSISIDNVKIITQVLTKAILLTLSVTSYYLCFADPTNGQMYISVSPITHDIALTFMQFPTLVPCIGDTNKDMIASVFTVSNLMALSIAQEAGIASMTPENHGVSKGYYWHYHSRYEIITRQGGLPARPHAFFSSWV